VIRYYYSVLHNRCTLFCRFVTAMPNGAVFITFSFILRAVVGVGTAMYSTASYALLTQLFSEHKGMIVVSQLISQISRSRVVLRSVLKGH